MATKTPNIVPLKLLVISLGFLLIGGTIFVAAALVNKVGKGAGCKDIKISLDALGEKGMMTGITPQGNAIQVAFSEPTHSTVVTFDRCTGQVQQRFIVAP